MKNKSTRLAQRYVAALKKHLVQGTQASLESSLILGHQAMASGLEALDLAKIHERAFYGMIEPVCSAKVRATMTKRARVFFEEVNSLVEATPQVAAQDEVRQQPLKKILDRRTTELALAKRQIQRVVAQRKVLEDAIEQRRELHNKCLEEPLELQKRLRQLTHRVLNGQETDRKNISRKLQDKIVQTLVGINVRLLTLKQEMRSSAKRLKNDIASTQRLVMRSATTVRRAAREFASHEPQAPTLVAPLPGRVAHAPERRRKKKPGDGARAGK